MFWGYNDWKLTYFHLYLEMLEIFLTYFFVRKKFFYTLYRQLMIKFAWPFQDWKENSDSGKWLKVWLQQCSVGEKR